MSVMSMVTLKTVIFGIPCILGAHLFSLNPYRFCCKDASVWLFSCFFFVQKDLSTGRLLLLNPCWDVNLFFSGPMVSLLTPTKFLVFTSVATRETVLVANVSISFQNNKINVK